LGAAGAGASRGGSPPRAGERVSLRVISCGWSASPRGCRQDWAAWSNMPARAPRARCCSQVAGRVASRHRSGAA
jgi:hypothetical protein